MKFLFAHNGFKVKRSCVIYSFQTIKIEFQSPQKLKDIKHQRPLLLVGISQIRARQTSSQIQLLGELKIFCDSKRTLNLVVGYGVMFNDSFPSYEFLIIMEILQQ